MKKRYFIVSVRTREGNPHLPIEAVKTHDGSVKKVETVAQECQSGAEVYTLVNGCLGARVHIYIRQGFCFLRTNRNHSRFDNLRSLPFS